MRKYRLIWCGVVLAQLLVRPVWSQDPHFSQYYAAPLYLNPALGALEKSTYIGLNYRNQWRSLGFPQKTGQLSAILPIYRNHGNASLGSVGVSVYNDVLGENNSFRTTGAMVALSRALYSGESNVIAAGLQAGVIGKHLDASQLQWGSQYDPFVGFDASLTPGTDQLISQKLFPVVHAGIFWHYSRAGQEEEAKWSSFAGLSVSNLNQPDESLIASEPSKLPILYKFHGGIVWRIAPKISVSPNWLWMRQNGVNQLNAGAYVNYHITSSYQGKKAPLKLSAGGWYRMGDSFIISTGLAFKNYTFGFSYDVNVSSLRYGTQGRGAYELSIAYRFLKEGSPIRRYSTPLM